MARFAEDQALREKLRGMREALARRIESGVAATNSRAATQGASSVPTHLADADDEGVDRAGETLAHLERNIEEIDAALDRLDAGRYGTCRDCGASIDPHRLEALPEVTRCVTCASQREGL